VCPRIVFSFKKHTTEMTSVAAMTCHWLRALKSSLTVPLGITDGYSQRVPRFQIKHIQRL